MTMRTGAGWILLVAVTLAAGLLLVPARADAQAIAVRMVNVNCGLPGQTIAGALRRQVVGGGLVVNITGTCNEHVDIFRDDVILRGAAPGATIHGPTTNDQTVFIDGARRVHLQDLTITGGSDGVSGVRGASFFLEHVIVDGAARLGVVASYGASAFISGSTVRNSVSNGVTAANSATVVITNSTVEGNTGTGIQASRTSHIRVGQDASGSDQPGPVIVQNNRGNGIAALDASAAIVVDTTVQNNSSNGIYVARGSTADIGIGSFNVVKKNTITNNGASSSGILVEGASAVIVGNDITGNGFGVQFINGGNGRLGIRPDSTAYIGNNISGNKLPGLGINSGSTAVIGGNVINANGTANNVGNRWGVIVSQGAANFIGQNTISNHADSGIFLDMATLFLGNGFAALDRTGNVISGNGFGAEGATTRSGIQVFNGSSAFVQNTTLSGNTRANVETYMAADVDIRASVLSAPVGRPGELVTNILVQTRGVVRLATGTIVETSPGDGVTLARGASLEFRNDTPVTIRNNTGFPINCFGVETSIGFPATAFLPVFSGNGAGDVTNNCSDY